MPGYDIRILDDDGDEVRAGETGAICVELPLPPGLQPTLWGSDERFVEAYLRRIPATTSPPTPATSTTTATSP